MELSGTGFVLCDSRLISGELFRMLKSLIHNEDGYVQSTEFLLLILIVGFGAIVGLTTFRDQMTQELADTGVALEQLDQSYTYVVPGMGYDPSVPFDPMMPVGYTVSAYDDTAFAPPMDLPNLAPAGITFPAGGTENDAFGTPTSDSN